MELVVAVGLPARILGISKHSVWEWEFLEWDVYLEVVFYNTSICCIPINLLCCIPNNLMPLIPQICGIGGEVTWVHPNWLLKLSLLVIWIKREKVSHFSSDLFLPSPFKYFSYFSFIFFIASLLIISISPIMYPPTLFSNETLGLSFVPLIFLTVK